MIDHLIRFEGEIDLAAFSITLAEGAVISSEACGGLVGDLMVTLLGVEIVNQEAEYDLQTGDLVSPAVIATGTWIAVRAPESITAWQDQSRLVAVTDNTLADADQPFVLYKNPEYPWAAMQGRVSPTFAGSHYPFGPQVDESKRIISTK